MPQRSNADVCIGMCVDLYVDRYYVVDRPIFTYILTDMYKDMRVLVLACV